MLTFKSFSNPPFSQIPFLSSPINPSFSNPLFRFRLFAQNNDLNQQSNDQQNQTPEQELEGGSGSNGDEMKKNGNPLLNIKWSDLLFDRDPDNLVAVGLTGLLTWASVQVLWQLLVVSWAILVAALKYSFIAALLIFILIALL